MKIKTDKTNYTSTRNACKLCTPLGACMVFKGIEGCVPFLHGSQGCATYIRRYMISHYKEPVDIASSNFGEHATIFGGKMNLEVGLDNIIQQYSPNLIGIASTCLSETIGDDIPMFIKEYRKDHQHLNLPYLVNVSTPSYQGTHMEGFNQTVKAVVQQLATNSASSECINIFPGFVSPEDLRYLKEVAREFNFPLTLFPDYSDSLDGSTWREYHQIPKGGTPLLQIENMPGSIATIEFGHSLKHNKSAGKWLQEQYGTPCKNLGLPIGLKESDRFLNALSGITDIEIPLRFKNERGRLIDAYVDGHKYVFGKKAIVYGEEDLVTGLISFLDEIGIQTILCASGGESGHLKRNINDLLSNTKGIEVFEGMDFEKIAEFAHEHSPDIMIGNSKGYYIARELEIPLVRVGFPIHDRIGAQRIQHLGYGGALQLFDKVTNALIEYRQNHSPIGYKYM